MSPKGHPKLPRSSKLKKDGTPKKPSGWGPRPPTPPTPKPTAEGH